MAGSRFSFLHISDLHILGEETRRQHGADTGAILRQAIPLVNALQPDLLIASGDLISDESEESYRRLQTLLQAVEAPIRFLRGNPDDRPASRQVFPRDEVRWPEPVCEAFEVAGVRFLLLDSVLPGKVEGELSAGQLAWLEGELAGGPARATRGFL